MNGIIENLALLHFYSVWNLQMQPQPPTPTPPPSSDDNREDDDDGAVEKVLLQIVYAEVVVQPLPISYLWEPNLRNAYINVHSRQ